MSHKVITAVYLSRLERIYKPLAAALGLFADDDGRRVFPGADTLAEYLSVTESCVRHHLGALKARGVLVAVGTRGDHTREFRFDLDRLKSYRPTARNATEPAKNGPLTLHGGATAVATPTLHGGATKPARRCHQPCTTVPPNLHHGAISDGASLNDHHDPHDPHEITGAVAPEFTRKAKTRTATKGPLEREFEARLEHVTGRRFTRRAP